LVAVAAEGAPVLGPPVTEKESYKSHGVRLRLRKEHVRRLSAALKLCKGLRRREGSERRKRRGDKKLVGLVGLLPIRCELSVRS
jgi:hypothetical protein